MPDPRNDAAEPAPVRTDWKRVADGLTLIGIGVFLLLAARLGLPQGFWADAVSFWPVFLVSAGLTIAFEKTRLGWLVLLGPVVVLGTLFWLGFGNPPAPPPPGEWKPLSAPRDEGVVRAGLEADLAGARLEVVGRALAPGLVAEGRVAARAGTPHLRPTEGEDGAVTLHLEGGRRPGIASSMMVGRRREVWQLAFSEALPFHFRINGAFIQGPLRLERLQLAGGVVDGAFNTVNVFLPRPREIVHLRFAGAFNACTVTVPQGVPVRLKGAGFPFNYQVSDGVNDTGWREGTPGYEISHEGVFSYLKIEEGPALPLPTPAPSPGTTTPDAPS